MSKLSKLLVPTEIHLAANKSLLVEMCFNGEIVLSFCHKKDFPPTFFPAFSQKSRIQFSPTFIIIFFFLIIFGKFLGKLSAFQCSIFHEFYEFIL